MSEQRRAPPKESGRRLATCVRSDYEELRVTLQEFQGNAFLNVRLWVADPRGGWFPDRARGIALRVRELHAIQNAVDAALIVLAGEEPDLEPVEPPAL